MLLCGVDGAGWADRSPKAAVKVVEMREQGHRRACKHSAVQGAWIGAATDLNVGSAVGHR